MAYLTDIEIAQQAKLRPVNEIAASLGIPEEAVVPVLPPVGRAA